MISSSASRSLRRRGRRSGQIRVIHMPSGASAQEKKEESAQHAPEQFIRYFSKQCSEPLSVIRWYSELLKDALVAKKADKDFIETVDAIHAKSLYLVGLLRNLFDYLSIESGAFSLRKEEVVLRDVLAEVQLNYALEAEQRGVKLAFDRKAPSECRLQADPARMRTVLEILIINAIQYSPSGSTATLLLNEEEGACHGTIQDQGVGIPKEDQQKIFSKGFRAGNAEEVVPDGAGLGLMVARAIIEAHGGKIWVESDGEGKGSTFHFTIPKS